MGQVFVIGLAGGIGSGKSLVAGELGRLGAEALDADRMVHALLCEKPVIAKVARRFGRGILDASGSIDRRALAGVAFRTRKSIRDLEKLLHPAVIAATAKRIAALGRSKGKHVVVIDAPLLFEAKMDRMCDEVIFVDAPKRLRLKRLAADRGWTRAALVEREKHQKGIDYKRRNADIVIRNDASPRALRTQVRACWKRVQTLLK